MARNNRKKEVWEQPQPLRRVDAGLKGKLLQSYNVRWRKGDIGILHAFQRGYSERDIDAYAFIGDELYAIHRTVNFGDGLGALRVFLGTAPALINLTSMFEGCELGEAIEVTQEMQTRISQTLEKVRQLVISEWVAAVRKTPDTWNLEQLMRRMKPLSINWMFSQDAVVTPVCDQLGLDPWDDLRSVVYRIMQGETILLPRWVGAQEDLKYHVFQMNDVSRRYWLKVYHGKTSNISSISVTLRLDKGPLGIVVNSTNRDARPYVEKLIEDRTYGDIVLLEGTADKVAADAKKLSDYLRGVDIIEYETQTL